MDSYKFSLNEMRDIKQELQYRITDDFFASKEYSPIKSGNIDARILITKEEGSYHVRIDLQGSVLTMCTLCLGDLNYDIKSSNEVTVKIVKSPREDDDYVYITAGEELDLEPLIYDFIILSIPERHVHEDGQCNEEMVGQLKQYLVN